MSALCHNCGTQIDEDELDLCSSCAKALRKKNRGFYFSIFSLWLRRGMQGIALLNIKFDRELGHRALLSLTREVDDNNREVVVLHFLFFINKEWSR